MESYSSEQIKEFKEWGVPLPTREVHGTSADIRSNMEKAHCTNWRMEGNKLIADTQFGPLVQFLPTDMICRGTDDKGLPILEKIVL